MELDTSLTEDRAFHVTDHFGLGSQGPPPPGHSSLELKKLRPKMHLESGHVKPTLAMAVMCLGLCQEP